MLDVSAYKRPVRLEMGGNIARTHLAIIDDENGNESRAFIKHFADQSPKGLFNEWFGACMMSALGVPQPKGALIPAPLGGTGQVRWAFASFTPGPTYDGTPKEIYDMRSDAMCKELIQRLLACHAYATMVAADQLCMNADRNMGNLVFTGKKTFVVIDHGEILGGNAWEPDTLIRPTDWVESKPISFCEFFSPLPTQTTSAIVASAHVIGETLWATYPDLYRALTEGSGNDARLALEAVWWRSLTLTKWFGDKLHLIQ